MLVHPPWQRPCRYSTNGWRVGELKPFGRGRSDGRFRGGHSGRTAVGISGIDQRRFRGAIRFLEAFARGEDAAMRECPPDVMREQFLRWVVDDLMAFYLEARMAQYPRASHQELYAWFWSGTALAGLLRLIRDRLNQVVTVCWSRSRLASPADVARLA